MKIDCDICFSHRSYSIPVELYSYIEYHHPNILYQIYHKLQQIYNDCKIKINREYHELKYKYEDYKIILYERYRIFLLICFDEWTE